MVCVASSRVGGWGKSSMVEVLTPTMYSTFSYYLLYSYFLTTYSTFTFLVLPYFSDWFGLINLQQFALCLVPFLSARFSELTLKAKLPRTSRFLRSLAVSGQWLLRSRWHCGQAIVFFLAFYLAFKFSVNQV